MVFIRNSDFVANFSFTINFSFLRVLDSLQKLNFVVGIAIITKVETVATN